MGDDFDVTTTHLASEAIQVQERLVANLYHRLAVENQQIGGWKASRNVIEECKEMRDKLRIIKSQAEGSAVEFEPFSLIGTPQESASVQQLRRILLQHSSTSMTTDQKRTCLDLLNSIFSPRWKRLLFAAVVSCPWYVSTQDEHCQKAKHNQLVIVYVCKDNQFFAPVNRHMKEKDCDVFEHEGWFYAAEVYHFAHYVSHGKVRFVELLYTPEASVLYSDEHWSRLIALSGGVQICGTSGFLEQCRGQAVGSVGRKQKRKGIMAVRETAKLNTFCESFRLLQHASCVLNGTTINTASVENALPHVAEALALLRNSYHQQTGTDEGGSLSNKESLFELVMQWRNSIDDRVRKFHFTDAKVLNSWLEEWLGKVRLDRVELVPSQLVGCFEESQRSKLTSLMSQIGGKVSTLLPEQIILIARAGSHLYGLAKADSDTDYVVVYVEPLQIVVSAISHRTESAERRGINKDVEFGAYEARLLAEMLWKGSVVILELVFAEDLDYCSEAWSLLTSNRDVFVTEQSILQYFGMIRNNMDAIRSEKHKGTPRELKLFYQVFHKLYCLEFFLRGEFPKIRCEAETRDFIMNIRMSNPKDFTRDAYYEKARDRLDSLKEAFNTRNKRLPEYANYRFLLNWLLTVRGVK